MSTPRAAAVIYAKDLDRVADFYCDVLGFTVGAREDGFAVLDSPALTLTVVAAPVWLADAIDVAAPPVRREETPIKLVLPVADIVAVRVAAAQHGGELDPAEREWTWRGRRVCDGHDPEGNVFQASAPAS